MATQAKAYIQSNTGGEHHNSQRMKEFSSRIQLQSRYMLIGSIQEIGSYKIVSTEREPQSEELT